MPHPPIVDSAAPPDWSVSFLRNSCSSLQNALRRPESCAMILENEADVLEQWMVLLAALPLSHPAREPLERLHLMHARVNGRLERGGIRDIAPDIEPLVVSMLADHLQQLTDTVIELLS